MIIITLGILLQLPIFIGIGLLLPWSPIKRQFSFESLLLCFFSGWGAAVAFLQIWHLLIKVDAIPLLFLIIAAGVGWYSTRRECLVFWKSLNLRMSFWLIGLAVLPAFVLANHVMFAEPTVDLGLYHMQTVKWINQFAIVPGLGNLHHRLAFNNASLLVAAVLDINFLNLSAYYLINTTIIYVMILLCGTAFYNLFRRESEPTMPDLFYALLLPVIIWQSGTGFLAGYTPDFLIFSLEIILTGEFLRLFVKRPEQPEFNSTAANLVCLVALGLTVKLSFACFGVLLVAAIFLLQGNLFGFSQRRQIRTWSSWVGLLAIWVIPWMVRSVILSGYPFFPSTLLSLPFPWRMPDYLAKPVQGVITYWARTRSETIAYSADWKWFLAWFERFVYEAKWAFLLSMALAVINAVFVLVFYKKLENQSKQSAELGLAVASGISFVGILYWFFLAPEYRFSGALFWILLICQALLAFSYLWRAGFIPRSVSAAAALVFLFTLWLSPYQFSRNISIGWLVMPPSVEQAVSQYRGDKTIFQQTTNSGLNVNLPLEAEGCWDAPLPCAPYKDFNPKLALLEPGNLQKGFYMEK